MKVDVIEVKVGDKIFGIELSNVKHFFEVENIITLPNMPPFIKGFVRYNNYIYPLISLKKAWGLEDDDSSTALAVVYKQKEVAFLIDDVIKIDSLEKEKNFLIEVFKEGEQLIGKLNLDFLESLDFPSFLNKSEEKESIEISDNGYLIFKCNEEYLAVSPKLVKKIEDISEKEILEVSNSLIKVEPFSKIYKECKKENILILEDKKTIGFFVGEIIDIIRVDKIVEYEGEIFSKSFIYNSNEVKVLSDNFLKDIINKIGTPILEEKKREDELVEVLILDAGIDIAVRMQNVMEIKDYNDIFFSKTIEDENIKGIIATKEGVTYLFSLEKILNKKLELTEDSKIIVLRSKEFLKAILVKEIKDLVYVKNSNIVLSKDNNTYIGGMVVFEDKMIPLLNMNWPKKG